MRTNPAELDRLNFVQPILPEQGMFRALVSEPACGVQLLSACGDLLYANSQAARIFGTASGPRDVPQPLSRDDMPPSWRDDIRIVFASLLKDGGHVLLRTIWHGLQVLSWATLLERLPFEPGLLPQSATWESPETLAPVMLLTSRHVGRVCSAAYFADPSVRVVHARSNDLGPLAVLTNRELQVLALLGDGGTLSEAAKRLHRSEKTIDAHRSAIHAKLGITDRVQLACVSQRLGLTLEDVDRMTDAGQL